MIQMSGIIQRAWTGGSNLRSSPTPGTTEGRVLFGHFAVFDRWTEIEGMEGHFMERIAPGAFTYTFVSERDRIRVLFQHGRDPQIGDKPLGPLQSLREDEVGGFYEARLLRTSYNDDLIPALEAGLFGASFRFRVTRENWTAKPQRSDWNPDGIPERTIREVKLMELGPVSFPAYSEATAGVRFTEIRLADGTTIRMK